MSNQVIEKIQELTNKRREQIETSSNAPHKTFKATFIKDESIGDVPIPIIYKNLYDPDTVDDEDGKGKNWIHSSLLERKDYEIKFENKAENKDSLPKFFLEPEFSKSLLLPINEVKINELLEEFHNKYPLFTDYHYYFVHPLKPVFLGPDKVNVHEHYKIHFVSPTSLIVEIFSYCSGFMLMDTFFTVIQYRYDSELVTNDSTKHLNYKTKVTVSYDIQFVKTNPFKGRVEGEGLKDNEEAIKNFWFPRIAKTTSIQSRYYYHGKPVKVTEEKKEEIEKKRLVEEKILEEDLKAIKVENKFFQNMITKNKYGVCLLICFFILLLSNFKFNNSLATCGLIGMGLILNKLDDLSFRLARLEKIVEDKKN